MLAAGREQARGLTAPYLHTLIQVCPWPRHAPAYARMVEADHARRQLRAAAEHLVQRVHDTSLPHPVQTVLAEADALAALVDDIASRFPPRAGVLPAPRPPRRPSCPTTPKRSRRSSCCSRPPPPTPADVESVRWLLPEDFTQPLHADLWQCLTTLVRRQEPVDPVTVLWEAQQRGLLGSGSEPGDVLRLLAEPAGSVEHWGERTLQRSLLATADQAGRRIRAYTDDPTNTPFQLVTGARRASPTSVPSAPAGSTPPAARFRSDHGPRSPHAPPPNPPRCRFTAACAPAVRAAAGRTP